jgi:hypothetical protein
MPRHTDSEIEQAAQRFEQLADTLAPTTAQVEGTDEIDGLINPPRRPSPPRPPSCSKRRDGGDGYASVPL